MTATTAEATVTKIETEIIDRIVAGLSDVTLAKWACWGPKACTHPRSEHEAPVAGLLRAALSFTAATERLFAPAPTGDAPADDALRVRVVPRTDSAVLAQDDGCMLRNVREAAPAVDSYRRASVSTAVRALEAAIAAWGDNRELGIRQQLKTGDLIGAVIRTCEVIAEHNLTAARADREDAERASKALERVAALSDKPDDYLWYDQFSDPVDVDTSNNSDWHSHGYAMGLWEAAVIARRASRRSQGAIGGTDV